VAAVTSLAPARTASRDLATPGAVVMKASWVISRGRRVSAARCSSAAHRGSTAALLRGETAASHPSPGCVASLDLGLERPAIALSRAFTASTTSSGKPRMVSIASSATLFAARALRTCTDSSSEPQLRAKGVHTPRHRDLCVGFSPSGQWSTPIDLYLT
jgi:hypothetical protein